MKPRCNARFGQHICGRPRGHKGPHKCTMLELGIPIHTCGKEWPNRRRKKR